MASGNNQGTTQSQLSTTDRNKSIEDQVKSLVTGLQSQDMFSNSTPVRGSQKLKENKKMKLTNKSKRQLLVFAPEQSAGRSTDPVPAQVISSNENDELPQSGQQLLTSQSNTEDSPDNLNGATKNSDEAIASLLKQFINNAGSGEMRRVEKAKTELKEFYIQQTRKRDRAKRNLDNINSAKEKTGRVPNGMQIKVVPEVPDNEQIIFKHQWAIALTEAEKLLSSCIDNHLESVIQTVDDNICDKTINTRDLLQQESDDDPMEQIGTILAEANNERLRINENIKKRKREANENNKGALPPSKKTRKE